MAAGDRQKLAGIGFMALGMLGMGGVDAFGKWFVTADYSPVQVIAVRGWVVTRIMVLWELGSGRRGEGHAGCGGRGATPRGL